MLLALGKSNIEQNIAKYYEAKTTINMWGKANIIQWGMQQVGEGKKYLIRWSKIFKRKLRRWLLQFSPICCTFGLDFRVRFL